jgi:hypothetical protein
MSQGYLDSRRSIEDRVLEIAPPFTLLNQNVK